MKQIKSNINVSTREIEKDCAEKNSRDIMMDKGWTRNCPTCDKVVTHKSKIGCYYAKRENRNCYICSHRLTPRVSEKSIQKWKLTVKNKEDWHQKIADNRKNNGTYNVSDTTKDKLKIIRINQKLKNKSLVWPNYNTKACKYFDLLNDKMGWSGQHALHIGEKRIGRFWVDYFYEEKNLVIEWDEKFHKNKVEQDKLREEYIRDKMQCKFIRIDDTQIKSFEDFYNIIKENI